VLTALTAGGFAIDNSLRFNSASSDYLDLTYASSGNRKTFTLSFWTKRAKLGAYGIFGGWDSAYQSGFASMIYFNSSDQLEFDSDIPGSDYTFNTNMLFRDVSAWYHIVISIDTTQATEANRQTIYVNGSSVALTETALGFPPQNFDTFINKGLTVVGSYAYGATDEYDGYMSEMHFIDGQALTPSDFGEFDSDTGIWKPIAYTGSYGTNGFFLEFKDSSALGDDTSGEGNDFTVNNLTSIDQTTDTPTNNFATMNPLASQSGSGSSSGAFTFSNGNLSVSGITSETGIANFGVSTGKWFWEVKVVTDQNGLAIGACNEGQNLDDELGYQSGSSQSYAKAFGYYGDNGNKFSTMGDGSQMSAYGDAISVNDIIGVAMNLDDNEVTFYLDGVAQGTFSITALGSGENYFPAVGNWSVATIATDFNFGNPPFAITTGNADANGYGNFEYEVPPGYYALCTNNLAEYG
jgi:hypothetical protein